MLGTIFTNFCKSVGFGFGVKGPLYGNFCPLTLDNTIKTNQFEALAIDIALRSMILILLDYNLNQCGA